MIFALLLFQLFSVDGKILSATTTDSTLLVLQETAQRYYINEIDLVDVELQNMTEITGSGPGEFKEPVSIAVTQKRVIVAGNNGKISFYMKNGASISHSEDVILGKASLGAIGIIDQQTVFVCNKIFVTPQSPTSSISLGTIVHLNTKETSSVKADIHDFLLKDIPRIKNLAYFPIDLYVVPLEAGKLLIGFSGFKKAILYDLETKQSSLIEIESSLKEGEFVTHNQYGVGYRTAKIFNNALVVGDKMWTIHGGKDFEEQLSLSMMTISQNNITLSTTSLDIDFTHLNDMYLPNVLTSRNRLLFYDKGMFSTGNVYVAENANFMVGK